MQYWLGLVEFEMDVPFLLPNIEAVAVNAGEKQTSARNCSPITFCPKLVEGGYLTRAAKKEDPERTHLNSLALPKGVALIELNICIGSSRTLMPRR